MFSEDKPWDPVQDCPAPSTLDCGEVARRGNNLQPCGSRQGKKGLN